MECKNFHDTEDRLDVSKRAGGLREPRGKCAGKYNTNRRLQGCHKQKTSFLLLAVFFVSNTFFILDVFDSIIAACFT